ncbi:MAG TPA: hypothetical protein VG097_04855 [Gemmata sp.]|jgi:hypothetical protein|nr:hypothetical protein [Gemmata sp.]
MNATQTLAEIFRADHDHGGKGVFGLIDEILTYRRLNQRKMRWAQGSVEVQTIGSGAEEQISVALRTSVLRTIIARLAALCNQQQTNSVSPYGGEGEFIDDRLPATTFRVSFCNTPDEQWFELIPLPSVHQADSSR